MTNPNFLHTSNSADAYKNNVMVPLNWFTGIADTALVSGLLAGSEEWVKIFCAVLLVFTWLFYAAVYLYFMFKSPDRLQSEGYNIRKQEIATLLGRIVPNEIEVQAVHQDTSDKRILGTGRIASVTLDGLAAMSSEAKTKHDDSRD